MPLAAQSLIVKHQFTVISWFGLLVLALVFYHLLSDGDFSFLLTLGAITRTFAFFILFMKMLTEKTVDGVSGKTLYLYAIVFISRLTSILRFEGYLPYDSSGDWLYQTVEVIALVIILLCIYFYRSLATDGAKMQDKFIGNMPILSGPASLVIIIIPVALLALAFHPNLNGHFVADYTWTFACYLETFALLPQLILFNRSGSRRGSSRTSVVSAYIANWTFALGVGRLLHFFFWWFSHHELNDRDGDETAVGWLVLVMQIGQIMIMLDFLYYFLKSAYRKQPMEMPSNLSNV